MAYVKDFKSPKGEVDWEGLHNKEVFTGERCYKCGRYTDHFMEPSNKNELCKICKDGTVPTTL